MSRGPWAYCLTRNRQKAMRFEVRNTFKKKNFFYFFFEFLGQKISKDTLSCEKTPKRPKWLKKPGKAEKNLSKTSSSTICGRFWRPDRLGSSFSTPQIICLQCFRHPNILSGQVTTSWATLVWKNPLNFMNNETNELYNYLCARKIKQKSMANSLLQNSPIRIKKHHQSLFHFLITGSVFFRQQLVFKIKY